MRVALEGPGQKRRTLGPLWADDSRGEIRRVPNHGFGRALLGCHRKHRQRHGRTLRDGRAAVCPPACGP